ncbi:protein of unknown function [Agreia sp. COWG]|nr:protein of unknown function [Agreia sp. COWG]
MVALPACHFVHAKLSWWENNFLLDGQVSNVTIYLHTVRLLSHCRDPSPKLGFFVPISWV